MPSLKEFRNRIASVKSTRKITKAMQMVGVFALVSSGCASPMVPSAPPAEALSDSAYLAAVQQIGGGIGFDMDLSHQCYVQAFIVAATSDGPFPDTARTNRNMHRYIADAYNVRIGNLLGQGQEIPNRFLWVGEAFRAAESGVAIEARPDAVQYREALMADRNAFDVLEQRCRSEVQRSASPENFNLILTRATLQ